VEKEPGRGTVRKGGKKGAGNGKKRKIKARRRKRRRMKRLQC